MTIQRFKIIIYLSLIILLLFTKPIYLMNLKIGIGKETFSYSGYKRNFFRVNFNKNYFIKIGGFLKFNEESFTYKRSTDEKMDNIYLSLINSISFLKLKDRWIFPISLETTYRLDYDWETKVKYYKYYDFGINFSVEYILNESLFVGYKFGYYLRVKYDYTDNTTTLYSVPRINNLLNSFMIYIFFN